MKTSACLLPALLFLLLTAIGCASNGPSDTEVELTQAELQEAFSSFRKEKGDWETLQSAFAVEVNRTGSFEEVAFTPDSTNAFWEFSEDGANRGDLLIRNKVAMAGCAKGNSWRNVYVYPSDSFTLIPPSELCAQVYFSFSPK